MKSNLNRNRLFHPKAPVLCQLLKGFALATAMGENLRAARPGVVHGPRLAPLGPAARREMSLQSSVIPSGCRQGGRAENHPCVRRRGRGRFAARFRVCIVRSARASKPADFRWFAPIVAAVRRAYTRRSEFRFADLCCGPATARNAL